MPSESSCINKARFIAELNEPGERDIFAHYGASIN